MPIVRVIDPDGTTQQVMPIVEARRRALTLGLDLVLMTADAQPPVCRLIDYGRFRFEQQQKERESKRKNKPVELKEVRFQPKISVHDLDTKARHIEAFLNEGHPVQVTVRIRGREAAHPEIPRGQLVGLIARFAETASCDQQNPALLKGQRGSSMSIVLRPRKVQAKAS